LPSILTPTVSALDLSAGHYAVSQLSPEHGLILSSIGFQALSVKTHIHGKRKKLTTTLKLSANLVNALNILDYFVNVLLPSTSDVQLLKIKKQAKSSCYNFDFSAYFELADTSSFVSERLLSKQDIFIPLNFQLMLKNFSQPLLNEAYFRMLRLPFQFYKINY